MSRTTRALVLVAAVLAAPAAACTVLLGAGDVPTPDDAGDDATIEVGPDGAHDAGGDSHVLQEAGSDAGADAACAPVSSTRCEGLLPEVCGSSGQWREADAACPFVCEDGGCTGVCAPNAGRCVGLAPQSCDGTGEWQDAGAACPFACEAGVCSGSCTPNTTQCGPGAGDAGSTSSVYTCDGTGQLHVAPCTQPTPDCTADAGPVACACTGSMCGSACAHLQTDPANCGTCGHSCLGGTCVGGACQPSVLASNQQGPYDIAIDGTNAYWVDVAGGTVNACALTGCNDTPTTLAGAQNGPTGITVNAGTVYWVNYANGGAASGSVMACAAAGCAGAPTPLAMNQNAPTAIAVGGGNAYWTGQGGTTKCATTSCTPGSFGPGGSDIVVDGTNAYWTAAAGPVRCALGGCGTPVAIATGQLGPWAIAVDGTNVYWTALSGFTVDTCVIAGGCGGNPTTVSAAQRPYDVAVDSSDVYWVDYTLGTVSRCAIGGCSGKATVVATGQTNPSALAVDTTAVYWVNYGNPGAVMKLAK